MGAAVAGRAALLAALALRARLLPLLALTPVEPLRQCRPARAELGKLGRQRLDPAPRSLDGLAQTGGLPGQRLERGRLATRSLQDPAQFRGRAGRRHRPHRRGRAQQPVLQPLLRGLGDLQGQAHPVKLRGQRPDRLLLVAQSPKLRNVPDNPAVLPPDRLLVALLSLQGLAQFEVLGLQRSEPVLPGPGRRCRRLC